MEPIFNELDTPTEDVLILICEKCGKKLIGNYDNPSLVLQESLKNYILQNNLRGKIRAVTTSCLSLCPEKKISIGIIKFNEQNPPFQFLAITPEEFELFIQAIKDF